MSSRQEFVLLAQQEGANIRALCRQFGISPKTGYKLLQRYADLGDAGLADRSRRPKTSPRRTGATLEAAVLALRDQHPAWGGRCGRTPASARSCRCSQPEYDHRDLAPPESP